MKKSFPLFLIAIFLLVPHFVLAAGFLDGLTCLSNGQCQLRDVETGLLALIRLMIGMVGALALLYFIWGGVQWLTSYGNQQKNSARPRYYATDSHWSDSSFCEFYIGRVFRQ
jgi:hypothetical protein